MNLNVLVALHGSGLFSEPLVYGIDIGDRIIWQSATNIWTKLLTMYGVSIILHEYVV